MITQEMIDYVRHLSERSIEPHDTTDGLCDNFKTQFGVRNDINGLINWENCIGSFNYPRRKKWLDHAERERFSLYKFPIPYSFGSGEKWLDDWEGDTRRAFCLHVADYMQKVFDTNNSD